MNNDFTPFDNESDVVRIGDLEVENRIDRVSLNGDLVLTRDQAGLALARELQTLIGQVVSALVAEKQLPQTVALKSAEIVKNPFS
ncbi:MAG: hypothetical protein ACOH2B_05670 [Burkholderiaceae bacterium]